MITAHGGDTTAIASALAAHYDAAGDRARAYRFHREAADQALAAANEAQACCDANRDRLERMFQRSQSK